MRTGSAAVEYEIFKDNLVEALADLFRAGTIKIEIDHNRIQFEEGYTLDVSVVVDREEVYTTSCYL